MAPPRARRRASCGISDGDERVVRVRAAVRATRQQKDRRPGVHCAWNERWSCTCQDCWPMWWTGGRGSTHGLDAADDAADWVTVGRCAEWPAWRASGTTPRRCWYDAAGDGWPLLVCVRVCVCVVRADARCRRESVVGATARARRTCVWWARVTARGTSTVVCASCFSERQRPHVRRSAGALPTGRRLDCSRGSQPAVHLRGPQHVDAISHNLFSP